MKRPTLIQGVSIVSMDPVIGDISAGDILIEEDTIADVDRHINARDPHVVDGTGLIAIPGFVDTHRHTWQSAIRHSYAEMDPRRYFAEVLVGIGAQYEPQDVEVGNMLGAVSAVSAGTTTMLDWSHIQNSPEHSDAAVSGLQAAGIRAVFGHGWPIVEDDRYTTASRLGHPTDIRRLRAETFSSDDQLVTLAMAARGPEMTSPSVWQDDLRMARELGIRTTVHVGAYPHNARFRAVAQYDEAGMLGEDMTFVHCNRCGNDELAMIAESGASVSLGVHCELNSMGIGDIPLEQILKLGIRPSLSGDTETKCSGDMFTQMRMLYAHYRSWVGGGHASVDPAPALTLRDVLEFATVQGAKALGMSCKIGTLTPGKKADVVLLRGDDVNLAPILDPVAAIVLAAHEGNVDTVFVDGNPVKVGGSMVNIDHGLLIERAKDSQGRILARMRQQEAGLR